MQVSKNIFTAAQTQHTNKKSALVTRVNSKSVVAFLPFLTSGLTNAKNANKNILAKSALNLTSCHQVTDTNTAWLTL